MLNFFEKTIKTIFGDKHEKDRKALQPLVDKTNAEYQKLASLSNDELRAKTQAFKAVSYTHLDVYKRQAWGRPRRQAGGPANLPVCTNVQAP